MSDVPDKRWIDYLEEEDLAFVKRFILLSGSLKDLASAYDVSYPTLRLRLDRLIQKIQMVEDQTVKDDYERLLRAEFADGRLDLATFRRLLGAYQAKMKGER
jgi:hypothetical protein